MLGKIDVEEFSGTNLEMWKLKIEDLLIDWDLWDVVHEKKLRPIDPTLPIEYDVRDRKDKSLIRLCLTNPILINFHDESTTKKLWKKLSDLYQVKSLVNKIFLRKKLYTLRMEEGGQIFEHLQYVGDLVDLNWSMDG